LAKPEKKIYGRKKNTPEKLPKRIDVWIVSIILVALSTIQKMSKPAGDNSRMIAPTQTDHTSQTKTAYFLFLSVLGYFILKACYFALTINENIFPDEITWFGICDIFSRSFLPPTDSPDSYQYGLITHKPVLYFYLMGKILHLNIFPISNLIFLRLVNIGINILTVIYAWKTVKLLTEDKTVRFLSIVLLTNTTMFTFMSAAVNYDNLVNLFAILSLYYMLCFFINRHATHFLFLTLFALAGGLTKISFVPYAFFLTIAVLFHERKMIPTAFSTVKAWLTQPQWGKILLSLLCLLLFIGNLHLYLGNKIKFGRLEPRIDQVLTLDQALQFRLFARSHIAGKYRNGEITLREAQIMAIKLIKHKGDLEDTLDLLQRATLDKKNLLPRVNRFQYIVPWFQLMSQRTFGIAAHKLMEKEFNNLLLYYLFFIVAGILFLWKKDWNHMSGYAIYLLLIPGGYIFILMQLVNYKNYFYTGAIGSALTGRYLFPIIVPIYILASHALLYNSSKWWKIGVGTVIAGIFVFGDFPWFLMNATPDWFF
jgi:hypothetical protein